VKLREFDLVISVNNAEAKNISRKNLGKNAVHVSYLQGPPTQYYWGLYDQYLKNPGFGKLNFLARFGLKLLASPLRKTDFKAAQKPDVLLANSTYVKDEIKKYYHRDATVLHPNVDATSMVKIVAKISEKDRNNIQQKLFGGEDFFIVAGRQVGWKRIDLAIQACMELDQNLLVIGDGAEHKKLVELAGQSSQIRFLPRYNGAAEIAKYFVSAKAFIFPSLEPFGITPIEALAAGLPVVALKKGGALDFVEDGKNGVFFAEQTLESLIQALHKISLETFDKKVVQASALTFSEDNFQKAFREILAKELVERNET
jgi:glycosyltransferase involved in cell wall biosynthesis